MFFVNLDSKPDFFRSLFSPYINKPKTAWASAPEGIGISNRPTMPFQMALQVLILWKHAAPLTPAKINREAWQTK
jgi:hypothetical protein